MKKTKLLLSTPTFYPFFGGAEMRFRRYLPLLREHGIESSVFTGTPKAKKITQEHKKESWYNVNHGEELPVERYQDIEVARCRLPERPARKRLGMYHLKLREKIKSDYKDVNVIQFLSPFTMSSIETFKFAKKNNIATVVACTLAKPPCSNLIKQLLDDYQFRKIYSASDCIIVSSEEIRNYLINRNINNRIEIIPNGVDRGYFKPIQSHTDKSNLRDKLGVPKDRKILLNVGTIHPRKGTDLLLRAFKLIAQRDENVDLYILGQHLNTEDLTHREFFKEIERLLLDPILRGRVHVMGLVDNVNEYLIASDVFLFPSREEGMGNVVMEAMASGIPVVVTPYLGFPSIFGNDREHFIFVDFNHKSIANGVNEVLRSNDLSKDMIKSSLANVEENLSVESSVEMLANLYIDLKY